MVIDNDIIQGTFYIRIHVSYVYSSCTPAVWGIGNSRVTRFTALFSLRRRSNASNVVGLHHPN